MFMNFTSSVQYTTITLHWFKRTIFHAYKMFCDGLASKGIAPAGVHVTACTVLLKMSENKISRTFPAKEVKFPNFIAINLTVFWT